MSDRVEFIHNVLMITGLIFLLVVIAVPLSIFVEEGFIFSLYKKLRCKLGFHKMIRYKIRLYYCMWCKKPRDFPTMKSIDGGNKKRSNKYKF